MLTTAQQLNQALRMHELIADLGFNLGNVWRPQLLEACQKVLDHVGGSRGLMERVVQWAREFDTDWEARGEADQENYIEDIDTFFAEKWQALKAEAKAD